MRREILENTRREARDIFYEAVSDLFKTGPTLTNVMDLHVLLVR